MRKADIFFQKQKAGLLTEDDNSYSFLYNEGYLQSDQPAPVSLTLPLGSTPQFSRFLFPAFDGLIPEGFCPLLKRTGRLTQEIEWDS